GQFGGQDQRAQPDRRAHAASPGCAPVRPWPAPAGTPSVFIAAVGVAYRPASLPRPPVAPAVRRAGLAAACPDAPARRARVREHDLRHHRGLAAGLPGGGTIPAPAGAFPPAAIARASGGAPCPGPAGRLKYRLAAFTGLPAFFI